MYWNVSVNYETCVKIMAEQRWQTINCMKFEEYYMTDLFCWISLIEINNQLMGNLYEHSWIITIDGHRCVCIMELYV